MNTRPFASGRSRENVTIFGKAGENLHSENLWKDQIKIRAEFPHSGHFSTQILWDPASSNQTSFFFMKFPAFMTISYYIHGELKDLVLRVVVILKKHRKDRSREMHMRPKSNCQLMHGIL